MTELQRALSLLEEETIEDFTLDLISWDEFLERLDEYYGEDDEFLINCRENRKEITRTIDDWY